MAQFIFLLRFKFRTAAAKLRQIKDRIISESIFPCDLITNTTFHRSSYNFRTSVWKRRRYRTYKSCCTLLIRHSLKPVYQRLVLNIIRRIFAHIACRIDSRFFIQRIDFQPGIICQNNCIFILWHLPCNIRDRRRLN